MLLRGLSEKRRKRDLTIRYEFGYEGGGGGAKEPRTVATVHSNNDDDDPGTGEY